MLLIFGGTTEGRLAVEVCDKAGTTYYYSTKSSLQDVEMHNGVRLCGAMSSDDMLRFCAEHDIRCIINAAHPFAERLHKEIANTGLPVIRLMRRDITIIKDSPFESPSPPRGTEGVFFCEDFDDAVSKLNAENIQCLLALSGANTISRLKPYWQNHRTIFRILHRDESVAIADANGLDRKNLIFYNDSFSLPSVDDETRLFQEIGCDAIITKDSGQTGGLEAKVQAALSLGMRVFIVKAPALPTTWINVTGPHTLRRTIENLVPQFFPLKTGLTTGACATAATKAALLSLTSDEMPEDVCFSLPDGEVLTIPVTCNSPGVATVIKDSSDDPDVTKGCSITSCVRLTCDGRITFMKGEGVGTVTLPGLGIPIGEPAINPTPRRIMEDCVNDFLASMTDHQYDGAQITISVANGEELAKRTFNHKVGIIGGISIIGTSGIVHPLSNEAFIHSIHRELEVARAIGHEEVGLVAGMKSERLLLHDLPNLRCVHYGNFIGEALKSAHSLGFRRVFIAIMIGKAVKLAEGHLDTHSHKVAMNKEFLISLAPEYAAQISAITMARELHDFMPQSFFDRIKSLCHHHCRTVFPDGELNIVIANS